MILSRSDLRVTDAGADDAATLSALFELYAYDFSEILPIDVEDDGRFRVPPLDAYWKDPASHAHLVRVAGKLAGFALVQGRSRLTGAAGVFDMAEFFVMRKYRRHGVGRSVTEYLFDRFQGPWEVREKKDNHPAIAFWRNAIGAYTGGRFEDTALDDERWHGQVQRFDSRETVARRSVK